MKNIYKKIQYYSILISKENLFSWIAFSGIIMGIFQILEYSPDVKDSLIFLRINFIFWNLIPICLSIFLLGFTVKQYKIIPYFGYGLGVILTLLPLPNSIQIGLGATTSPYLLAGIIPITGIQGSVISIILTGIFIGKINRGKKDITSIFISLFLGGIANILVFEPLAFVTTSWLILSIKEILLFPTFFIILLMNIITPFFLLLGGRVFMPFISRVYVSNYDINLYNSLLSFTFFAWAGIALAFFIFEKESKDKTASLLASLSSFFGLSTPFVLGYLFRYPFLFIISIIGGLTGFLWINFFEVKAWTTAYHGLPSFMFYTDSQNFIFILGSIIIIFITFSLTFFALKKRQKKH